ncbi:MAG: 4-alpha-glucanotransferase, partial [Bacteroidaceae bacterium]|nr:4-alpha-glucanotransferase [Bacteroidaceae bacterium]
KLTAQDSPVYDKVALYYYIQYQLHRQLLDVRNTAREAGVIIKGDIPIGISRNSVEAWSQPHLFNLDGQAGAPPDDFSANGQNWGFPTYNWEAMAADGYQWWIRRFQKMAEYFDAYRIDHVLGFFRIWEIPQHSVHGLLGHFSPSLPMSVHEIESYGMRFNAELMTRPFITDETLERTFGYRADLVKSLYLQPRTDGRYDLKDEYASQRRIEAAFAKKTDEDSMALRDGLYALASCVLFVPDHKCSDVYHPRISAQLDFVYASLPQHEKEAFNRLYNEYYFRRHNKFWYEEAMKKLPILTQSTRMLVCAEDLGMVPDCVPWVMNDLRMLSLEIQTMSKRPELQFGRLWENPYRSVATISTHDMPPLRMWWEEDMERTQQFYNSALYKDGTAPHPAPGWLCEDIVAAHLFCSSALKLLSLQDWLSIDEDLRLAEPMAERINIPANPRHNWQYRMHLTIEQLMNAHKYNAKVKSLIENSGRA